MAIKELLCHSALLKVRVLNESFPNYIASKEMSDVSVVTEVGHDVQRIRNTKNCSTESAHAS
eukprot:3672042-Amphidinium_carterae.1